MQKKKLKCIAIDDDPLFLMKLTALVKQVPWLHMEQTFTNPIEAGTEIIIHKPDLVFLDVEMPYINGFELVDWIEPYLEAIEPKPQVIIITGKREALNRRKSGVIYSLFKPDLKTPDDLIYAIEKGLDSRKE